MTVYCDASLLVSFITKDAFTDRALQFFAKGPLCCISDFAAAEVASAVSGLVRMRRLRATDALSALGQLDLLRSTTELLETTGADVARAESYLKRLDLPLRTPDALNLALAARTSHALATFDNDMKACAAVLGIAVEDIG